MSLPDDLDPARVAGLIARCQAAGWSISAEPNDTAEGRKWVARGSDGDHAFRAEAATEREAWQLAIDHAMALGMLGSHRS